MLRFGFRFAPSRRKFIVEGNFGFLAVGFAVVGCVANAAYMFVCARRFAAARERIETSAAVVFGFLWFGPVVGCVGVCFVVGVVGVWKVVVDLIGNQLWLIHKLI